MKTCTPCVMEAYIEQYGWTYRSYQTSTWKTGHGVADKTYDFLVHMTSGRVRFEISPFVDDPIEWDLWPELSSEIEALKASMSMSTLTISEAGDLTIAIEVSADGLDYNNFCNIIIALSQQSHSVRESITSKMKGHGLFYYQDPLYLS